VDDEHHFLFKCQWQPLVELRREWSHVVGTDPQICDFMDDLTSAHVRFVGACMKKMRAYTEA
jgi:hypothetical protein